ncbi:hypothetical protein Tco_1513475 [Tanacetum coccineum]
MREKELMFLVMGCLAFSLINTVSRVLVAVSSLRSSTISAILSLISSRCLMVIESEVLNDFLIFIGVFITEFAVCGAVNLAVKMKGDMIIENLNLEPVIDAISFLMERIEQGNE